MVGCGSKKLKKSYGVGLEPMITIPCWNTWNWSYFLFLQNYKKPLSTLPSYLWKSSIKTLCPTQSDYQAWSKTPILAHIMSCQLHWQFTTRFALRFINQSFENTSLSTNLPAGLTVSIVGEEKHHCITAVKFHIRSPAEHHLRGFLSLAVKLIWTCVRLPFMEQEAVGSVFPQHTSAPHNACEDTMEMKTHGENNKLIRRMNALFSLSSKSPSDPPVMNPKKKRIWKHPRLPAARDTLTLRLSLCYVQVWVSTFYK